MFTLDGFYKFENQEYLFIDGIDDINSSNFKKIHFKGRPLNVNLNAKSKCPFFKDCLGCQFIHMNYDKQFSVKKALFNRIFDKYSENLSYFSDDSYNYKSKVRVHLSIIDNQIKINLNGKDPNLFFPCLVMNKKINDFIIDFNKKNLFVDSVDLYSFNELIISLNDGKLLVTPKKLKDSFDYMLMMKLKAFEIQGSIIIDEKGRFVQSYEVNLNDKSYNLFYDNKSFLQSNLNINEKMIIYLEIFFKKLSKEHDLKSFNLYDFFSGNGNFSVPLSKFFKKTFALESNKSSEMHLREANKANETHVKPKVVNLNKLKSYEFKDDSKKIAILDPPRKGIFDKYLRKILADFDYVIYVSCEPKVIKRQIRIIAKHQKVINVAMFDNFAFTRYFESIVVSRKI